MDWSGDCGTGSTFLAGVGRHISMPGNEIRKWNGVKNQILCALANRVIVNMALLPPNTPVVLQNFCTHLEHTNTRDSFPEFSSTKPINQPNLSKNYLLKAINLKNGFDQQFSR